MREQVINITTKEYDNTLYIVENVTGDASHESTYSKVKRLILSDAEHLTKESA